MLFPGCVNTPICNNVFHCLLGAFCKVLSILCERGLTSFWNLPAPTPTTKKRKDYTSTDLTFPPPLHELKKARTVGKKVCHHKIHCFEVAVPAVDLLREMFPRGCHVVSQTAHYVIQTRNVGKWRESLFHRSQLADWHRQWTDATRQKRSG